MQAGAPAVRGPGAAGLVPARAILAIVCHGAAQLRLVVLSALHLPINAVFLQCQHDAVAVPQHFVSRRLHAALHHVWVREPGRRVHRRGSVFHARSAMKARLASNPIPLWPVAALVSLYLRGSPAVGGSAFAGGSTLETPMLRNQPTLTSGTCMKAGMSALHFDRCTPGTQLVSTPFHDAAAVGSVKRSGVLTRRCPACTPSARGVRPDAPGARGSTRLSMLSLLALRQAGGGGCPRALRMTVFLWKWQAAQFLS